MNRDWTPTEEQAMDSLLEEVIGSANPPDLSDEILKRLAEEPALASPRADQGASVRPSTPVVRSTHSAKGSVLMATMVFAVAASLMALAGLYVYRAPTPVRPDLDSVVGTEPFDQPKQSLAAANSDRSAPAPTEEIDRDSSQTPPLRSPEVAVATSQRPSTIPQTPETSRTEQKRSDQLAASLVSSQMATDLEDYWEAVGITSHSQADDQAIAGRLEQLLGVQVPSDVLEDPEQLQQMIRHTDAAYALASKWLAQITEGGFAELTPDDRELLVADLAACFTSGEPLDRKLVDWISGDDRVSAAFYAAMSKQKTDLGAPADLHAEALLRRLAALSMNVDLRCIRCHDSFLEGVDKQSDYWAFAALVNQHVQVDSGKIRFDSGESPMFYELADGRQGAAEAAVRDLWTGKPDQPIERFTQWSTNLVGSMEFARGLVNSLWTWVHGKPIHSSIVDPMAAPDHESISRVQQRLATDIVDNGFDVSRALALVISVPSTTYDVPESLRSTSMIANQSQRRQAREAIAAFAAARPLAKTRNRQRQLDELLRTTGPRIDPSSRAFVAQQGSSAASQPGRVGESDPHLLDGLPMQEDAPPAQWLELIDDPAAQVDHLAYLSGYDAAPRRLHDLVRSMRRAGVDESLSLHRVWWLLTP